MMTYVLYIDLNDFFAKQIKDANYSCMVLPCTDGEFAFSDNAPSSIHSIIFISVFINIIYYVFVY